VGGNRVKMRKGWTTVSGGKIVISLFPDSGYGYNVSKSSTVEDLRLKFRPLETTNMAKQNGAEAAAEAEVVVVPAKVKPTADKVSQLWGQLDKVERANLTTAREIGKGLAKVKAALAGQYEAWITNTLGRTTRMASLYVRIADNWDKVKAAGSIRAAQDILRVKSQRGPAADKQTGQSEAEVPVLDVGADGAVRPLHHYALTPTEAQRVAARASAYGLSGPADGVLALLESLGVPERKVKAWVASETTPSRQQTTTATEAQPVAA
jgi:hypothetical protein